MRVNRFSAQAKMFRQINCRPHYTHYCCFLSQFDSKKRAQLGSQWLHIILTLRQKATLFLLMYNLFMRLDHIPDSYRKVLKAVTDLDPRNMGQIAEAARISRPFIANIINGDRSVDSRNLFNLLDALDITKDWTLDPAQVHYWVVGADVSPLIDAVNHLIYPALIWPLTRTESSRHQDPYRGIFLFTSTDPDSKQGLPLPPYVLVYRDRFHLGRGNKRTVSAEDAKPILPSLFSGARWAPGADEKISLQRDFDILYAKFKRGVKITEVSNWIGKVDVTWDRVHAAAKEMGLTPSDVLALLERSSRKSRA